MWRESLERLQQDGWDLAVKVEISSRRFNPTFTKPTRGSWLISEVPIFSGGVLIRKPEIKPRSSDARVEDEKQDQPQPLTNGRVVREIQLEPKILHSIEIVSPSVSEAPCKFYALRSFFFAVWYCGKAIGRRSADCIAYGVKGRRPSKISPEQCLTQRADIGLKRRRARSRYAGCDDTLDQCLPLTHSNRKLTGLSRDAKRSWNLSEGFGWCKPLHSEK